MRILLIASGLIAASTAPGLASAQTSNPIRTIELPPSKPPADDPFAADPAMEEAATSVGDTSARPDRTTPPDAAMDAGSVESASVAGRVDTIIADIFGPSEEEERAVAARLYAEQIERDRLEALRVETLNREARERADAEHARRLSEYRAEVERINSEHEARMAEWRARVAACEAGDRTACGP